MMIELAILVAALHAAWLLLVIIGALWTRGRPLWSALHIAALLWGIVVEVGPWGCPLTLAESYFEARAGAGAYQASTMLHILENIVYPNLPAWIVTTAGVAVCVFNLGIYGRRFLKGRMQHEHATDTRP
jgi:hypothetical protein